MPYYVPMQCIDTEVGMIEAEMILQQCSMTTQKRNSLGCNREILVAGEEAEVTWACHQQMRKHSKMAAGRNRRGIRYRDSRRSSVVRRGRWRRLEAFDIYVAEIP